jgi:putative ABC transport system substrate-binding protein
MRRREFIILLGGAAAAWPHAARAQQPTMPVIGYISTLSEAQTVRHLAAFRRGLSENGFTEGGNVRIEYRWAEGQYQRLPAMAAELVRRPVSLMLAQAPPAALAAKAATATIPIVFVVGFDPVGAGLVASLNHPGGNATGMTLISFLLGQKRLEILRDISPKASVIAMLANPLSPDAIPEIGSVQAGAQAMGLELAMFNASTASDIDVAFAAIAAQKPDALLVGTDPFFTNQRAEIVARAAGLKIPAIYPFREYATSIASPPVSLKRGS